MSFIVRIFLLLFITLILEFYFYRKFFNSLKSLFDFKPSKHKGLIFAVIAFLNLYLIIVLGFWVYTSYTGERFRFIIENRIWDMTILYPYWISVFVILQVVFLILPLDILRLIVLLFGHSYKSKINKINYIITFTVTSFFILYVPARVIYDYYTVDIHEVSYSAESLPEGLRGFKIALVADIQADWYTDENRLANFMEKVNSTNPDLILMAGDMITGTPDYIKTSADELSKLNAKYGIYTCVGDHDNWAYRGDLRRSRREVTEALSGVGIEMVDNQYRKIDVDSSSIGIAFITESYSQRASLMLIDSLVKKTAADDLKIVVVHQPVDKVLNNAVSNNINLMLSGHTHGGQVTFLFPFINLTPTIFETQHVKGEFYYEDLMLSVTKGLGMSLVPLRYNATPEVTLITIN